MDSTYLNCSDKLSRIIHGVDKIHTLLTKVLAPLVMKGLTTLVISMSTDLNVEAYNDILGNLIV